MFFSDNKIENIYLFLDKTGTHHVDDFPKDAMSAISLE